MFEGEIMKLDKLYSTGTIVVICAMLVTIQAVSAAPTVDVESPYPDVAQEEMFTVNITIDPDGTETLGAQYNLYFNNSLLRAICQNNGSFLSQDGTSTTKVVNTIDNTNGRIVYGEVRTGVPNGVTDSGILATIDFEVIGYGVDEFRLFNVKLSDPDVNPISDIIVQSRPSSQFLIDGYVSFEDGSKCTNPTVKITNIDIGMEWKAMTSENSNYYKTEAVGGADIIVGDVLRFNVTSPDGSKSNIKDHTVTQDEIDNSGIFNFNITTLSSNSDRPSTSSGSSGSGGSGGGGTSGEAFDNILISETEREYVNKGLKVSYSFNSEGNVVQHINFTGVTSSGQIAAKVEILDHTSALADHAPSGIVYKNLNIWVGNLGWASSRNIANPTVNFKVEKTWVSDNNVDKSSIKLNRYTEEAWNQLVTTMIGEDANYMYFDAETSGFSPFAITGKKVSISSASGASEMNDVAGSGAMEEKPDQTPDQTPADKVPGFNLFACVFMLLTAVKILHKKK